MLVSTVVVGAAAFVAGLTLRGVRTTRASTLATAVGLAWIAIAALRLTVEHENPFTAITTGFVASFAIIACAPLGARLRERISSAD